MQPPAKDLFGLHLDKGAKAKVEFSITEEMCWQVGKAPDVDAPLNMELPTP